MIQPLIGFLRRQQVSILAILFVAGMVGMLLHFAQLQRDLVESTALVNASHYSLALSELRTLYTSEVVETARANGTTITHDYAQHPGAIPLPATLSMLLGNRLGETGSGLKTRLYSPYPFPWRGDGGMIDTFGQEAWVRLLQDPDTPFYRFEDYRGVTSLRYATADLMRSSCVDCHNGHPSSPKRDWREGDLRGVLEVVYPLSSATAEARAGMRDFAVLMAVIFLLALGVFGLLVTKQRRTARDLAERTLVQAELKHAKEQAEAASQSKSEFLANVTHELRTPLHGVLGFAGIGIKKHESTSPAKVLSYFESIQTSGERLLGLVNGLLELAEFEAGKHTLELRPANMDGLISQVIAEFHAQHPERQITFLTPDRSEMKISLDPDRIRMVIRNLLDNAVKFSPEGGEIEIDSQELDDVVRVTVRDHGVGVPAEELEEIFGRFVQSTRTKTGAGGTGLGLSVCREIVNAHGGRIWAKAHPDYGAVFSFEIPVLMEKAVDTLSAASSGSRSSQ